MHAVKVISAIAAVGITAVAAKDTTCTSDVKVSAPTTLPCEVVAGNVEISNNTSGDLTIKGVEKIQGDLIITDAKKLVSFSSDSLESVGGELHLEGLELLSSLELPELTSVDSIKFLRLHALNGVTFGKTGVTKATSIDISDTHIEELSGLNIATVEDFNINNNKFLKEFKSDLVNITGTFITSFNGDEFQIDLPKLEMAGEFQIGQVKSFKAPKLEAISQSLKFDNNPELESFAAKNLTNIKDDLSFVNNSQLANISFPALTEVGGGFKVQNNTNIDAIDGFDDLKKIGGGMSLRGNFSEINMPKLKEVGGTVIVTSTNEIDDVCDFFDKIDDEIAGELKCKSNNPDANNGGDDDLDSDSGSSKKGGDDEGAAGMTSVSMTVLGLSALVAVAQLL